MSIEAKFARLGVENAPGQEVRKSPPAPDPFSAPVAGPMVDFSHGDVDAFPPIPGSFKHFSGGVGDGGRQAYTEYRGSAALRDIVGARLSTLVGASIDPADGLILTSGTQGALYLALASTVSRGDKVVIVQPDYFANRKVVDFLEGIAVPLRLDYASSKGKAGLDLDQLEAAFRAGARVLVLSNPNNPTGVVYSEKELQAICTLAESHGATVIVDQLYARLCYEGTRFTHLCAMPQVPENLITIMGPSKFESLSGYRLGVAFGTPALISRMERLQAIVCLRAAGYNQAVFRSWLAEPAGWVDQRIRQHQAIRDDLLILLRQVKGLSVRTPKAGSYVFPTVPALTLSLHDFVRVLRETYKVIVTPGTEFSPQATQSIRLNFSQDRQRAVVAIRRLMAAVERYRP